MSSWLLVRLRRWPALCLLLITGLWLAQWIGGVSAEIPGADGPRVVRQYLVAILPCLTAPALLNDLGELSATLVRERSLRVIDQLFEAP